MRNTLILVCTLMLAVPAVLSQEAAPVGPAAGPAVPAGGEEAIQLSPAEQKIAWAEKLTKEKPANPSGWNALAMALARRARETGDPAFYEKAHEALTTSLRVAPDNYEARRTRVWVLLGQHEFATARNEALGLSKECPDDLLVHGLLTDACVELGSYDEAEKACQWMLDLRPGTVPGLTRAAYLRELFGMMPGAIAFMREAYEQTPVGEREDRAWTLTHLAHLELSQGRIDAADDALRQAFVLFPGYHYALAQQAKVHAARGEHEKAAEMLSKRYEAAPHPENLFDLAVALVRCGKKDEAAKAFAGFETGAVAESDGNDNANRELIWYWADHAGKPEDALKLALTEIAKKKDVHTRHAFAWALFKNGRHEEARQQIDEIIALGWRDASLLYHAGKIAAAGFDREAARAFWSASLAFNPASPVAAEAKAALGS